MVARTRIAAHTCNMAPPSADVAHSMALYVDARRSVVTLRKTKWRLMWVAQQRLFKSSKECQALGRICCWDPTEEIRSLADDSACRFADIHGDHLFKVTVDGMQLPAVTSWFYGTLPGPEIEPELKRTKRFTLGEFMLLDEINHCAQMFMTNVAKLPLMDLKRLRPAIAKWNALFAKARAAIIKCSPACQGFVWLLDERRMPCYIARLISEFCGEY
jgi:hypothetical protein